MSLKRLQIQQLEGVSIYPRKERDCLRRSRGGEAKLLNSAGTIVPLHFYFCAFARASPATLQNKNAPLLRGAVYEFAESEGFEPPDLLQSTVFKTAAIDHSASSPRQK